MSGLNVFACFVLRLANWIAGPARQDWSLAMAAETEAADGHGTVWAFGCLHAAAKDRVVRDWRFAATIAMLPVLAMVVAVAATIPIFIGARMVGIPATAAIPMMLLCPMPAAWLLGRMRPTYSPVAVGTAAFIVHQATPMIAMVVVFGILPPFWSPNMTYYNMPSYAGLPLSWLVWVVGTWWGGSTRRTSIG